MSLDPWDGVVEQFTLSQKREILASMPPLEGAWPNPASLSRFGLTQMPLRMLKRFERKIKVHDMGFHKGECWLWQGGLHDKGYGRFHLGFDPEDGTRITAYAHRIAFEHWVGMPPMGYIVDHECEIKTCCNPAHLWPQTNADNLRLADERSPWKRRNQFSKE